MYHLINVLVASILNLLRPLYAGMQSLLLDTARHSMDMNCRFEGLDMVIW